MYGRNPHRTAFFVVFQSNEKPVCVNRKTSNEKIQRKKIVLSGRINVKMLVIAHSFFACATRKAKLEVRKNRYKFHFICVERLKIPKTFLCLHLEHPRTYNTQHWTKRKNSQGREEKNHQCFKWICVVYVYRWL